MLSNTDTETIMMIFTVMITIYLFLYQGNKNKLYAAIALLFLGIITYAYTTDYGFSLLIGLIGGTIWITHNNAV